MALSVLGLVLPNFTTSLSGPRLSTIQEEFLIVTSLALYAIFLMLQTRRHQQYFTETQDENASGGHEYDFPMRSTGFHAAMLFLYLIAVIVLAEKFAIPLDNCVERLGMQKTINRAIVERMVLAPN